VTDFATLLQDPYRYGLEKVLRLQHSGDDAREMDGGVFGTVAHEVLSRFGHSPGASSSQAAEIARWMEAILDDVSAAKFGRHAFPAVRLQIEKLRQRLRHLADWQASWVAGGWRTILVEGSPPGLTEAGPVRLSAPFEVDGVSIQLTGRIDRVDYHAQSNRVAILDYKTGDKAAKPGDTHRMKRSGAWKDLQLPLYRHLLANTTNPPGAPIVPRGASIDLGYILVPAERGQIGAALAGWSSADLEAADETARGVVRLLREGSVDFDPSRVRTRVGDPLAPLLGLRLLRAAALLEDEEMEGQA
jgi:hypothetical protein